MALVPKVTGTTQALSVVLGVVERPGLWQLSRLHPQGRQISLPCNSASLHPLSQATDKYSLSVSKAPGSVLGIVHTEMQKARSRRQQRSQMPLWGPDGSVELGTHMVACTAWSKSGPVLLPAQV